MARTIVLLHRWLPVALPAIAVVAGVSPLLSGGFGLGHDWLFELVRIAEFRHALFSGQLPPFWASNLYEGFGSPIFLFYAPLYLAISSALASLGGSLTGAASVALVLFSVLGAVLVWRFVDGVCPGYPAAARIAVVLYSLHPYLLADKWIRNANAEFAALAILPGVLIGATAKEPRSAFWWTTLSLAGVILAHNVTALVAIVLVIAISFFVHRGFRALRPVGWGIFAALALTAFFWIPALTLQPLIRSEDLLTGKFDFHAQFPDVVSLFWPGAFYSGGWLTGILVGAVLLIPVANALQRRILRGFGIAVVICLFLMLRVSTWIWEALPLLHYEQFPWRLMGPLAVLVTLAAGIVASGIPRRFPVWCAEIAILVAALLNAYPSWRDYEPLTPEIQAAIEQALTPEGIRSKNLRTTVYDEYLPRAADPNEIRESEELQLFRRWAFPVFSAEAGGRSVRVERGPGGVAAVRIQPGMEAATLTLREPPLRTGCKAVSAFAAVVLFGLFFYARRADATRRTRLFNR